MGQLLSRDELKPNPYWYFEDAYYCDGWCYEWPNPSYPYQMAIHDDNLQSNKKLIEIRKWITENIVDTVIHAGVNKSYFQYYDENEKWRDGYQIHNKWTTFHFENEHSATMFKLRFGDIIQEITDKHPREN